MQEEGETQLPMLIVNSGSMHAKSLALIFSSCFSAACVSTAIRVFVVAISKVFSSFTAVAL